MLDSNRDSVFVVSRYILDAKPYNEEAVDITWEDCTLRQWLNETFYHIAFNDSEQENILVTEVVNKKNALYNTRGGGNTKDRIFLLSADDLERYYSYNLYHEDIMSGFSEELITEATAYAKTRKLFVEEFSYVVFKEINDDIRKRGNGRYYSSDCVGRIASPWWLRTPGYISVYACTCNYTGSAGTGGCIRRVDCTDVGVRPAICIKADYRSN